MIWKTQKLLLKYNILWATLKAPLTYLYTNINECTAKWHNIALKKSIIYRYRHRSNVCHEAWVDHEVHHSRRHGRYHCHLWCRRRSSYFRTTRRGSQVHTLQVSWIVICHSEHVPFWTATFHTLPKSQETFFNLRSSPGSLVIICICCQRLVRRFYTLYVPMYLLQNLFLVCWSDSNQMVDNVTFWLCTAIFWELVYFTSLDF